MPNHISDLPRGANRVKLNLFLALLTATFIHFGFINPAHAGLTFGQNQADVVIAPECNHVPIGVPYLTNSPTFDESSIIVSSDSSWAIPSVDTVGNTIDIAFDTANVIVSYTATITVDDGEQVHELFIRANVSPLNIFRLLDDPYRSVTYGIQRDGINPGAIIAFDPIQEQPIACITVGAGPSDFVINDDSTELLVINSVDQDIDVIDLVSFSLKETIDLPQYQAWGDPEDTTANIELGPGNIIYYIDANWGPFLYVLDRSTGTILQAIDFYGNAAPAVDLGFMDIAVSSDKTKMVAMPQYGWSAGVHSRVIGQYTINPNGTVNYIKEKIISEFPREPFEAPALMRGDGEIAILKTISADPADIENLDASFVSPIWSISPNGKLVATADKIFDYVSGNELLSIPGGTTNAYGYIYSFAQAFTSDLTRFVYFDTTTRAIRVINLVAEIGLEQLGAVLQPAHLSVVNSPTTLMWSPVSGIDQYDVYLGDNELDIETATISSPTYLGRITGASLVLLQTLNQGSDYFWRVDPVTFLGPEPGPVFSFKVSDIALSEPAIKVTTVAGHKDFQVNIELESQTPGLQWSAHAADAWVSFTQTSGNTPSTLEVHLDTTGLSAGVHFSSATLTTVNGALEIPIQFEIEPLKITHIRSDRTSALAYAISEDISNPVPRAYLLEIDTLSEEVIRVLSVGSSVTDFAIHYADNLLYVTNWASGNLLVVDKTALELLKSIPFTAAGATGYSEGDVYRVAAGVSQRIVVEEEDQWIDISLFNTASDLVEHKTFVREGGGDFDPTGRYYYHGENNSSGASILKFDIAGDQFTELADVRPPEIASYYGSRTVVVSEDGTRIFWSGVVFDEDLTTEWATNDIVYSASTDGRYAFTENLVYDIDLQRVVLAMPTSTRVSGYNSSSSKLVVQVGEELTFYTVATPITMPEPELSVINRTDTTIELGWTDQSLETVFYVQQRTNGAGPWIDILTSSPNVTGMTVYGLEPGTNYEFRVRASSPEVSSSWSNLALTNTTPDPVVSEVRQIPLLGFHGFVVLMCGVVLLTIQSLGPLKRR